MRSRTHLLAAACLLSALSARAETAAAPSKATTVRWVLAHTSGDAVYTPLLEQFARRVEKKSDGALKIVFIDNPAPDSGLEVEAHRLVLEGGADMGQFEQEFARYVPAIVAPFVFRSYAHAEAVYASPLGERMLDDLYAGSDRKLRGLAFTYSGGFRVLFGKKPVSTAAAFKGLRMVVPGAEGWSPLTEELLADLGVNVIRRAAGRKTSEGEQRDLGEGVVNRAPRLIERHPEAAREWQFVNRTNHSMLVTAILANEKFLSSLPKERRRLLLNEVRQLASDERSLSISLEKKSLALLASKGIVAVELPEAERRKLTVAADAVFARHPEIRRRVEEIRAIKDKSQFAAR